METYWEVEQQRPKQDGFQKDETRCTDALLMRTEREVLGEPINHWLDESITREGDSFGGSQRDDGSVSFASCQQDD